jgi:hypothetical protein
MSTEAKRPRFALERLTLEQIIIFGGFVVARCTTTAQTQFQEALDDLLNPSTHEPTITARLIEDLALSPTAAAEICQAACQALPRLAEREPEVGFTVWRKVAQHSNPEAPGVGHRKFGFIAHHLRLSSPGSRRGDRELPQRR